MGTMHHLLELPELTSLVQGVSVVVSRHYFLSVGAGDVRARDEDVRRRGHLGTQDDAEPLAKPFGFVAVSPPGDPWLCLGLVEDLQVAVPDTDAPGVDLGLVPEEERLDQCSVLGRQCASPDDSNRQITYRDCGN